YGFRFVNGHLVASTSHKSDQHECSMHIVCPHCTTSYAINPGTLGASGRTVRCARCKEVWLARPEDAVEPASAMAEAGHNAREREAADEWHAAAAGDDDSNSAPHVESPPLAGGWQSDEETPPEGKADWIALVRHADNAEEAEREARWPSHFWSGVPTWCACCRRPRVFTSSQVSM